MSSDTVNKEATRIGTVREDRFLLDRLVALKYAFFDIGQQPFDIRNDLSCSYRVLSNLIMCEQLGPELECEGRIHDRELLEAYRCVTDDRSLLPALRAEIDAALADPDISHATLAHLVSRCLTEADWATPEIAENHRRAALTHVARLERMERHYRAVVTGGQPQTANKGHVVDFDALAGLLGDHDVARISPLHQIAGGYSKVTFVCQLERTDQSTAKIVVRSDAGNAFAGTSVLDEYPVLKAMHEAGVAVPRPIWAGRTADDALPVLVIDFVEGQPFGSPATAAFRSPALCRSMGTHLARIHCVESTLLGPAIEDGVQFNRHAVNKELDAQSAQMRATGQPAPLLEYAVAWLRNNLSSVGERVTIVHGDYAPQNILSVGDEISAVLDWEFVKLGNPVEDLCFGRLAIQKLGSWDDFLDAYEAEGGIRPQDDEVKFYTIFGLVRLCIMMLQTDTLFHQSETKSVRMATPGAERLRPILLTLASHLGLAVDAGPGNSQKRES